MEYHTSACAGFRASEKVLSFSHISFLLCHLSLSHSQSFISVLRTITSQISQCINPRSHFSFSFFAYFLEKQTLKLPCFFFTSQRRGKKKRKQRIWGSLIVETPVSRWWNGVLCKPFFLISLNLFFFDVYNSSHFSATFSE